MADRPEHSPLLSIVVVVVIALAVALIAVVAESIDGDSSAPVAPTTSTTWSETYSFCDVHEHRIYIGPTNGAAAPNVDVVEYEPSCRRENQR